MSAVQATAACSIQVVFRCISFAAIASSQNSIFAEYKLPGQMQILFQAILFVFPAIRFIEVQHFTQFIIMLYIHLKLYCSVLRFYNSKFINVLKASDDQRDPVF